MVPFWKKMPTEQAIIMFCGLVICDLKKADGLFKFILGPPIGFNMLNGSV